jgi:hypothetical protein
MGHSFVAGVLLVAAAQAPPTDTIARQLESTDTRTVAWGAYNAGAYHRDDLIPHLQRILDAPPATGPYEEHAFISVVMDAFVQLKRASPGASADALRRQPAGSHVHLVVGCDRSQGRAAGFAASRLRFPVVRGRGHAVRRSGAGLATHLVHTVTLQLTIHVADTDGVGIGAGSGGGGGGCGIGQNPVGYPPHAEYRFEDALRPGHIVLATGPHPVYYSRTVTRSFQYGVSRAYIGGPSDEDRMAYLRAMSLDTGESPLRANTDVTVRWSTADALVAGVQQLRSDVERRFRRLVELASQYYPVPAGLIVNPPIDVRLVDRRNDQAVPLPTIGP